VQSKVAFARLLDELGAPQPRWWPVEDGTVPGQIPYPYFLKSAFSTAGQGVRQVRTPAERVRALAELRASGQELIAQALAPGQYGQVQALFDHGRLVAAHTSVQAGPGMGGSAAARLSIDHPRARSWAAAIGEKLAWHGGLTMDYFHQDGEPVFIECNPRTVEPGNAAASGVSLPLLSIALTAGQPLPEKVVTGRPGVRTHGTLALLLGSADQANTRRAVLRTLNEAVAQQGVFAHSAEVLTPVVRDPPSLIPLLRVATALLARPASAAQISGRTVAAYSVTQQTITRLHH
jgi:biotin carboxylase